LKTFRNVFENTSKNLQIQKPLNPQKNYFPQSLIF